MKSKILLTVILTFTLNTMYSQSNVIKLWENDIPNNRTISETEIIEKGDITKISNVQIPTIEVFRPSPRNSTGQAVVICPGGGYHILAYDWEGTDIAKWLNSLGITAIVLKYRLPISKNNIEPHKSPLLDAKRALRIVRHNADKWNIDKSKIGIMGFSAGGHLASTLSTHFDYGDRKSSDKIERESCRPDFTILIYPVISIGEKFTHKGSHKALIGNNMELINYYSNDKHVSKDTPQAFLVHAADDKAVPVENSITYYRALLHNNIKAELHTYPYGGHGFSLATGKGHLSTWTDRCEDWLKYINN